MNRLSLAEYSNEWFDPGRGIFIRSLWFLVNALVLKNPLNPSSCMKIWVLKAFGAKIGDGVFIKPCVNIKYPWNLEVGANSWIGEGVWIDSLSLVSIGTNVCISQGVYLCTGNHDWNDRAFRLIVKPITIESGAWIGANSTILPGVNIGDHSVVSAAMVLSTDTEPYKIYRYDLEIVVKERVLKSKSLDSL